MSKRILIAGATGNLGGKIVDELLKCGAEVIAITRLDRDGEKIENLTKKGVTVHKIDMQDPKEIAKYCENIHCVVSALSGLKEVIIDAQVKLLEAAVMAKVPRFIPSDFSIDYTNLIPGQNRNLDLRRDFHAIIDQSPIKATSIFNGAFMELLTGDMPLIINKYNRILAWGNPDQKMEFTTTFNIASFTSRVALEDETPRHMHIAGSVMSSNDFVELITKLTNQPFKILHPGSIGLFNFMIKLTKLFVPGKTELYPPWQGMQYMRDMMEGRVKVTNYYNNKYLDIHWTSSDEYLAKAMT